MALPETVRVKLSPENAGYLSVAPVIIQEMPLRELVGRMLGVAGKRAERIRDLLLRGALVSGATRFRWSGFEADLKDLAQLLATFPEAEPARPFAPARCVRVVLSGPHGRIEISREAGQRRRWLRRASFWDLLLSLAAEAPLEYQEYSYKEGADLYRLRVSAAAAVSLRSHAALLRYRRLENQVRTAQFEEVVFFVNRP